MQVDTQAILDFAPHIHSIWGSPIEIIAELFLLYFFIGWAMFAGLAALLVLIPYNVFICNKLSKSEKANIDSKDMRIKMMNEILSGIKVYIFNFIIVSYTVPIM
jgi:ATP-binding cassette subfamily C (CFTR/MRP) protein 1